VETFRRRQPLASVECILLTRAPAPARNRNRNDRFKQRGPCEIDLIWS
jgi:hypothetical protein